VGDKELHFYMKSFFVTSNLPLRPPLRIVTLEEITEFYEEFYSNHQSQIGHYLRNLCALFEFVANSDVENPRLYSNIVLAQLSTGEMLLLFYTGLSELGSNKLKPLIERFGLLEGLYKKNVIDPTHLELYKVEAYGRYHHQGMRKKTRHMKAWDQ
jgi:Putative phage abortive infection protein